MSKTNKDKLMKMNLQMFAAEDGLTTMDDLGEIKSIDFVNLFEKEIKELLTLLGVTRKLELSQDMKIQMYEWAAALKDGDVAEGEDIPLSKVTRKKGNPSKSLGRNGVVLFQRKQSLVMVHQLPSINLTNV